MPFSHLTFTAPKPPPEGFPTDPETLGTRFRKRRMDLGLQQKEVAMRLGVHPDTIKNWENGGTEPALKSVPKVLEFLGGFTLTSPDPGEDFTGWFTLARRKLGLTQWESADRLGVAEKTVRSWERGEHEPNAQHQEELEELLTSLLSRGNG